MRISQEQQQFIVSSVKSVDQKAQVYLFGSRTNDNTKGGDIDILVLSENIDITAQIELSIKIREKLDDFPFDVVVKKDSQDAWVRWIMEHAIQLN